MMFITSRLRAGAAAALAACTLLTAWTAAHAQETITLKMQATWPASLSMYENFTSWAKRVDQLTGGAIKIVTMPAGQVVPAFEVLDATHKKVIDGGHAWTGYWIGKNKTGVLFTGGPGGPFGMDTVDSMGWMYEGGGFELYQEYYRDILKRDVIAIPVVPFGPQSFGWFKRPVQNLEDFKGMKCRQTGIAAEVWQRLGMKTVNMPGGEIIPSAQRGVIDCAEWVGGVEDQRLGFHTVWKYYYPLSMHESVTYGELLFNADVWKSLSAQHQEIIKAAATETFYRWWARWQVQNADSLKEMTEKHGVQVLRTPPDLMVAFLKEWDALAKEESAKDPFFKKVLDSQRAYASKVVPAKRVLFPPYSFAANYYWPEGKK